MLELTENAQRLLRARYYLPDEDWSGLCLRAATHAAPLRGTVSRIKRATYHRTIAQGDFIPSRMPYMGTNKPFCSSCFVLGPIEDSRDSIFSVLRDMAEVQAYGGGTGYNFSRLRPEGSLISTTRGQASGPVSFMRLYNDVTKCITRNGNKGGAQMGILNVDHPDILKFIAMKDAETDMVNFNVSVGISDAFMQAAETDTAWDLVFRGERYQTLPARELLRIIAAHAWKNGEPGVIFLDTINRYNPFPEPIEATNACVTGDTLVATADGRNAVPIRELAQAGQDVPVYAYGPEGLEVRMGRNPRLIHRNARIVKVTLDDGSSIRTTLDHEFLLRDGAYRRAEELKPGDSLMPFYKYQYENHAQLYWGIHLNAPGNNVSWAPEHRLIAEYITGKKLRYPESVVHHRDYNGLNNTWDNLLPMSHPEHREIHRKDMLGDNNPMRDKWWNKLSVEEREAHRARISEMNTGEGNPMFGREHSDDTKALIGSRTSDRMTDGMKAKISNSIRSWYDQNGSDHLKGERVERIEVPCDRCGTPISLTPGQLAKRSDNGLGIFCSRSCVSRYKAEHTDMSRYSLDQIVEWGKQYYDETGELPTAQGWDRWTAQHPGVCSREAIRKYFGGFRPFKKIVAHQNHSVVSVELAGYEDVYDITVDEHHNLAYITNLDDATPSGHYRMSGIMTHNCSEQPLPGYTSCNLGSVNLKHMVITPEQDSTLDHPILDADKLRQTVRTGVWFLNDSINHAWWPIEKLAENTLRYRNIGLGVMGFADLLIQLGIPYASEHALEFASKLAADIERMAQEAARDYATVYATTNNTTVTSIAPTGSISILGNCSSGIEPLFGLTYVKNTALGPLVEVNPLFEQIAKERGFYTESLMAHVREVGSIQDLSLVPADARELFRLGTEIPWEQHVTMQAIWQHCTDAAVSKTVNLPNDATVEDVIEVYRRAWQSGCKSITVYRDGSREVQAVTAGTKEPVKNLSEIGLRLHTPEVDDGQTCTDCTL